MKMFLGDRKTNTDKEVNAIELKAVFDTLKGDPDGGDVEMIVLSHIDQFGNLFFDIETYSTFGG
jgi:hypothetical protein